MKINHDPALTEGQAAEYLNVSVSFLQKGGVMGTDRHIRGSVGVRSAIGHPISKNTLPLTPLLLGTSLEAANDRGRGQAG